MTTIISAPVYTAVVLGSANYGTELLVTNTGSIYPAQSGPSAIGVYGNIAGASVDNYGGVQGGGGYSSFSGPPRNPGGPGGAGVDLASATLINHGSIAGGAGGYSLDAGGGTGGAGALLDLGIAINYGSVVGGTGGGSYTNVGVGGIGVVLDGGTLTNGLGGTIDGGNGGPGVFFGGHGGAGVDLLLGANLTNNGGISGGGSGEAVRGLGGPAGIGVVVDQSTLTNGSSGTIHGGDSTNGYGGTGVDLADGSSFTNFGRVYGGDSGHFVIPASGGTGVELDSTDADDGERNTLVNYGLIVGGNGGRYDSSGGNGVNIGSYDTLTNGGARGVFGVASSGSILGGKGGNGFFGGTGGNGADVGLGGTLTNNYGSTITGGAGGNGYATKGSYGGNGGAGVYLAGGTLITGGTIGGGAGGGSSAPGGTGTSGDAVLFGSLASILVIEPGAKFLGQVVANSSVNDVLQLAGSTSGLATGGFLSGLGTQFTDFTTLSVDAGAAWNLRGANTLGANTSVLDAGNLNVTGKLIDAGTATVDAAGVLRAGDGGTLRIGSVVLAGGKLAGSTNGKLVVGANSITTPAGLIWVEASGTIAGFGMIAGAAVKDNGTITAQGGKLVLATAVSGTGEIEIAGGAQVVARDALSLAKIAFLAGTGNKTLVLDQPAAVTSALSGFGAHDFIDLENLAPVTSLSFAGDTLTLYNGANAIDSLTFAGSYTTANFTHTTGNYGGTVIGYHV